MPYNEQEREKFLSGAVCLPKDKREIAIAHGWAPEIASGPYWKQVEVLDNGLRLVWCTYEHMVRKQRRKN